MSQENRLRSVIAIFHYVGTCARHDPGSLRTVSLARATTGPPVASGQKPGSYRCTTGPSFSTIRRISYLTILTTILKF